MTFAWYGHLKYRSEALWKVILASWGIAFFEYCFQVPANRRRPRPVRGLWADVAAASGFPNIRDAI